MNVSGSFYSDKEGFSTISFVGVKDIIIYMAREIKNSYYSTSLPVALAE
jgi:hypothetical protein